MKSAQDRPLLRQLYGTRRIQFFAAWRAAGLYASRPPALGQAVCFQQRPLAYQHEQA